MRLLTDSRGAECAELDAFNLDGLLYGLTVRWLPESDGDLDLAAAEREAQALMASLRASGARHFESRIVRETTGVDPILLARRAASHTSLLRALGFEPHGGRIEVRLPVDQAIDRITLRVREPRLAWQTIATERGPDLDRAAALMQIACVGDPNSSPDDDALGFLLARLDDEDTLHTPETLQIGVRDGRDAVILILAVNPANGWCSHHYLGVAPEHRQLGLSVEAMLHGLRTMHALGGREYHDGTSAGNHAALRLLEALGPGRRTVLEQWAQRSAT
ncbi:MAG: hypothetical protein U0527_14455 [Candidatus Eisenbacteria bacterium]